MNDPEKATFFERLQKGLQGSIAFSRGELSLKTTTLPAPPPKIRAEKIASLRRRLRMSQAVFAATLNVSPKTVQSWEQGDRQPADAALRMLEVVEKEPKVIQMILLSSRASHPKRAGKRRHEPVPEKIAV